MPSAPRVKPLKWSAASRMISVTEIDASTKYGPRSRKVMLPTMSDSRIAFATPAQMPHHGAMWLISSSIIVVYAPIPKNAACPTEYCPV